MFVWHFSCRNDFGYKESKPYCLFQKASAYSLKFNKQFYSQEDWKKNSLKRNWTTALPDCTSNLGGEVKGTWLWEPTSPRHCAVYFCKGSSLRASHRYSSSWNFPQIMWQGSPLGLQLHFSMQENPAGLWDHYSMNQKYRIPKWRWSYGLLEHFLSQWKCLPSA